MTDLKLRNLEREAASGDPEAEKLLCIERCRQGNCCLHETGMARFAASDWYLRSRADGLTCCWCGRRTFLETTDRGLHGPHVPDSCFGHGDKSRGGYRIP